MTDEELRALGDQEVLYLTTTGRQSGMPRTIEIWFTVHAGNVYLNAEQGTAAQWVQNILCQPRVQIRLGNRHVIGRARALDQEQDRALWQTVVALSHQKYGWGEGLPVEIVPLP